MGPIKSASAVTVPDGSAGLLFVPVGEVVHEECQRHDRENAGDDGNDESGRTRAALSLNSTGAGKEGCTNGAPVKSPFGMLMKRTQWVRIRSAARVRLSRAPAEDVA
jgi:hypothetical protein